MGRRRNHNAAPRGWSRTQKAIAIGGAVCAALVLAGEFGFHLPSFEGTVTGSGQSEMDMQSYGVSYLPRDCASSVTALSGVKTNGTYHLPIIKLATGTALVDKKIPVGWNICADGSKNTTSLGMIANKVTTVVSPIPPLENVNVAVGDLNLDICLPLTSEDPNSVVKPDRIKYIKDALAHHPDSCDPGARDTGIGITEGTSASTIELSHQLADMAAYTQSMPRKAEEEAMKNAQRAMIATEKKFYPHATTYAAPLSPISTPFAYTMSGFNTMATQTDVEIMFQDIHFSEVNNHAVLDLQSGNIPGSVTLQESFTPMQIAALNHDQAVQQHAADIRYAQSIG